MNDWVQTSATSEHLRKFKGSTLDIGDQYVQEYFHSRSSGS